MWCGADDLCPRPRLGCERDQAAPTVGTPGGGWGVGDRLLLPWVYLGEAGTWAEYLPFSAEDMPNMTEAAKVCLCHYEREAGK